MKKIPEKKIKEEVKKIPEKKIDLLSLLVNEWNKANTPLKVIEFTSIIFTITQDVCEFLQGVLDEAGKKRVTTILNEFNAMDMDMDGEELRQNGFRLI